MTPEDFESSTSSRAVTATALPLGSTETLQQTETLSLMLASYVQLSVDLNLTNTSTIMAAGRHTVSVRSQG